MIKFADCNAAHLVSTLAASLASLSDGDLKNLDSRVRVYPADQRLSRLSERAFAEFDLAACKAEMIRRALRVGKGFGRKAEAA